jgi:hypothetical protein
MDVGSSSDFKSYHSQVAGRVQRNPAVPSFMLSLGLFTPLNPGISSIWASQIEISFICTEVTYCALFIVPAGEQDLFKYVSFSYANPAEPSIFGGTRFPASVLCWGLGGGSVAPTIFRPGVRRRLTSRDHLVFVFGFPSSTRWHADWCFYSLNLSMRYTV